MSARTDSGTALADRSRAFWAYYRRYTTTAIHAAATAALTAFGLLIFIDPVFAWLAIAAYVLPPVVLYATGRDVGGGPDGHDDTERPEDADRTRASRKPGGASDADRDVGGTDADHDHDGIDRDNDGIDRDTDGPDRDYDGPDRDSDGDDSDADGTDRDADGADLDRDG